MSEPSQENLGLATEILRAGQLYEEPLYVLIAECLDAVAREARLDEAKRKHACSAMLPTQEHLLDCNCVRIAELEEQRRNANARWGLLTRR